MPTRPLRRPLLPALLTASLLLVSSPAVAIPRSTVSGIERAPSVRSARALVGEVRRAMAGGRLADVLAAAGVEHASGSSAGLAGSPITTLSNAITQAGELIRAALPPDAARARARMLQAIRMHRPAQDVLDEGGHQAVEHAAAMVASAIDAALPHLIAMTPPEGLSGTVAGCDIADQAPALCAAGPGANVIEKDYALVVDLGGADTHANSAGGADTLENGLPVSVTIDLGGNDTYTTKAPTSSGSSIAQGGGLLGAGFLVDVFGDDTYRIATDAPFAFAMGQGKALSGAGVLADLAGNDVYELDARGPGYPQAVGQGDGAHGPGVLVDLGGNDRHAIRATATEFIELPLGGFAPPFPFAAGLGTGAWGYINFRTPEPVHADGSYRQMGIGLFADAGGMDDLSIDATVLDPPDDNFFGPGLIGPPGAAAIGVGAGQSGGVGLAVLGPGDTSAVVSSTTHAQWASALTEGMGVAVGQGQGVLSDAGGNDVRTLRSYVAVQRNEHVADGCSDCESPQAWARTGSAEMRGMGSSSSFGLGLLEDAAGDDRYLATATNVVETTFRDERAGGNPGRSVSTAGSVTIAAQGVGESSGIGALNDAQGNDRYEVSSVARASARATHPGQGPEQEATAIVGDSVVLAQASGRTLGSGSLSDLGGSDTYVVASSASAEAIPHTTEQTGASTAAELASVDEGSAATFVDRDAGETDSFTAFPAAPAACTGTRADGAWVDCGGAGFGLVA